MLIVEYNKDKQKCKTYDAITWYISHTPPLPPPSVYILKLESQYRFLFSAFVHLAFYCVNNMIANYGVIG